MKSCIRTLVQDYGWIHTSIGAVGNFVFFIGSIFFLPSFHGWLTMGVWLFVLGSLLMMFGAVGDIFVKVYEAEERKAAREVARQRAGMA
jgi:YrhK-like protein